MNWKRGFFRLWMAFATVCLISALVGNVHGIISPYVNRNFYYNYYTDVLVDSPTSFELESDRRALRGETVDLGIIASSRYTAKLPGDISITFLTYWSLSGKDANKVRYGMWHTKEETGFSFRFADVMEPRLGELLVRAEEIVRVDVAKSRLQSLGYLVGVGAGIPLAVLAFGAAIAWILQGFRSKGGTPT